ncbi:MAG TPA: hypothetical protein VME69_04075 [Methylocella sp.]|nr:hypothetical protein [Methylocella sp.]
MRVSEFGRVWIVDIGGAAIEIYRQPADGAYGSRDQRNSGSLSPALAAGAAIDAAVLFA